MLNQATALNSRSWDEKLGYWRRGLGGNAGTDRGNDSSGGNSRSEAADRGVGTGNRGAGVGDAPDMAGVGTVGGPDPFAPFGAGGDSLFGEDAVIVRAVRSAF